MPRFVVAVCVMLALIACAPGQTSIPASGPPTTAADEDIYGQFNIFCLENFGVVHEPLTTKLHGDKFRIIDGGDWQHVSENSACIAWETSLPAHTHVEYGATADYGRKTTQPERPFYIHVHYLQGLKPDTTYHYRLVSVDEKGARVVGEDKTFTTQAPPNTVHLPGDMGKPPYVLTKPGTYVLTEDINSPSTFAGAHVDRSVTFGAAIRPTSTRALEIGGEARYYADINNWVPRATLGLNIPAIGRIGGDFYLTPSSATVPWSYGATATLDVVFPHVALTGGATMGSTGPRGTAAGFITGVAITAYREPGIPMPQQAIRVRISDEPGVRSHVKLLQKL